MLSHQKGIKMRERPILFNPEMVRAILDGRKTQTRRVIKPQPVLGKPWKDWMIDPHEMDLPTAYCPYGIRGDQLWVRESFSVTEHDLVTYKADNVTRQIKGIADSRMCAYEWKRKPTVWRPSIFMPRWASRLTLEITSVRVERVQQMARIDAWKEGMSCPDCKNHSPVCTCIWQFSVLWNSINAKRGFGWDVNPWVWVIEFRQVED